MDPLEALWHFGNFFGAPLGVGFFASVIAKLLWHGELKGVSWLRLWAVSSGGAALACIGGLLVFGHDGKMATYGAMASAIALALWWLGFGPRRR